MVQAEVRKSFLIEFTSLFLLCFFAGGRGMAEERAEGAESEEEGPREIADAEVI